MANTKDLWTVETLDGVVQALPATGSFFKNTFFSKETNLMTEDVRIEFKKGKRRVAPFVNKKDKGKVVARQEWTSETYTPPYVKVKDVTTIDDMLNRLPGELLQNSGITPLERGIQLEAETMADFQNQIDRRIELMCANALLKGKIEIKGDNIDEEIDFGFTNTSTPETTWEKPGATPIQDLQTATLACIKNGYRRPNVCIMDRDSFNAFLKANVDNKEFDHTFQAYNGLNYQPRLVNENLTFMGRLSDPALEIYVYEEWYIDDWTNPNSPVEKPIMEKGTVLLASSNAEFRMYFGLNTFVDTSSENYRQVMGRYAADSWVQKDPDARFLQLQSRPLPVPVEVDSWYVLTGVCGE